LITAEGLLEDDVSPLPSILVHWRSFFCCGLRIRRLFDVSVAWPIGVLFAAFFDLLETQGESRLPDKEGECLLLPGGFPLFANEFFLRLDLFST